MDVEIAESVRCPFCGGSCALVVDTTTSTDCFNVDCDVCCRPFEVKVQCEPGRITKIEIEPG